MTPETASLHPAAARLRQFIIADLCAIGVRVLLCHGMYLWLLPSPWLLGLAAVVSADGVVIASATDSSLTANMQPRRSARVPWEPPWE